MTNWRDLPIGKELDIAIGKRRGWCAVNVNDAPDGVKIRTLDSWCLMPPSVVADGWNAIRHAYDYRHAGMSEAQAWEKYPYRHSTSMADAYILPLGHAYNYQLEWGHSITTNCSIVQSSTEEVVVQAMLTEELLPRVHSPGAAMPFLISRAWMEFQDKFAPDGDEVLQLIEVTYDRFSPVLIVPFGKYIPYMEELNELEEGDSLDFRRVEMTRREVNSLPEFDSF